MPKFKVGDQVAKQSIVLPDARLGTVVRVIPNKDGIDMFTEYEIEFGDQHVAVFYETQLRLVKAAVSE